MVPRQIRRLERGEHRRHQRGVAEKVARVKQRRAGTRVGANRRRAGGDGGDGFVRDEAVSRRALFRLRSRRLRDGRHGRHERAHVVSLPPLGLEGEPRERVPPATRRAGEVHERRRRANRRDVAPPRRLGGGGDRSLSRRARRFLVLAGSVTWRTIRARRCRIPVGVIRGVIRSDRCLLECLERGGDDVGVAAPRRGERGGPAGVVLAGERRGEARRFPRFPSVLRAAVSVSLAAKVEEQPKHLDVPTLGGGVERGPAVRRYGSSHKRVPATPQKRGDCFGGAALRRAVRRRAPTRVRGDFFVMIAVIAVRVRAEIKQQSHDFVSPVHRRTRQRRVASPGGLARVQHT